MTPGARPAIDLARILAEIEGRVPYLRASAAAPADQGWIPCTDLCRPGPALDDLIASTGAGRGALDRQVAASLFVQGYAFRAGGIALGAYALGLPVPTVEPGAMAIRISRDRPSAVAILDGSLADPDPVALARRLLGGHMAAHVDAVRAGTVIGARLLWGNVASSTAVAFRAFESILGGGAAVRRRGEAFIEAARPWLAGRGGFTTVHGATRDGWYWDRTSCCLWYRASGGSLCDDCSLIPADELAARRQAELRTLNDRVEDDRAGAAP